MAINKTLTSHVARVTFITRMIRLGVNLPTVMKLAGHKRIEQTMEYVKLVNSDVEDELERVGSVV